MPFPFPGQLAVAIMFVTRRFGLLGVRVCVRREAIWYRAQLFVVKPTGYVFFLRGDL